MMHPALSIEIMVLIPLDSTPCNVVDWHLTTTVFGITFQRTIIY